MSNEIKYNGETIATPEDGAKVTIPCEGKMMAGDISVEFDGKLEYINTITFTEEGRLGQINTDYNGNPFELKKFVMFGRNQPTESTTTTSGTVYVLATVLPDIVFEENTDYSIGSNGGVNSSNIIYWSAYYEIKGFEKDASKDRGRMMIIDGLKSPTNYIFKDIPEGTNGFRTLGVFTSSNKAFLGVGTTVDIYGVRV